MRAVLAIDTATTSNRSSEHLARTNEPEAKPEISNTFETVAAGFTGLVLPETDTRFCAFVLNETPSNKQRIVEEKLRKDLFMDWGLV